MISCACGVTSSAFMGVGRLVHRMEDVGPYEALPEGDCQEELLEP